MEYNIPNWTREHLGEEMTVDEFLNDSLAQDKLAGIMFTKRIGKYGNLHDPVSEWFSGQPLKGNYRCDTHGTCVPQYVESVLLAMSR